MNQIQDTTNHRSDPEGSALREMVRLSLPVVATMVSYTLMQFVDKFYVAQLGAEELAAAGNGGIAAFFPVAVMMGILGVVNTYVSQNLGAGTPQSAPAYAWNALWLCLFVWLFVLLPYAAGLSQIMHGMRALLGLEQVTPKVAELEVVYARILLGGMFLTLAARGLAQFFFGLHRPTVVFIAATAGNLVNWYLTWALVFGKHGFPAWGVAGSAVGTVIGTAVELAIPATLFLSARYHHLFRTRSAWRFSPAHVRDILKIGWPAGLMFGNEMICWWVFMAGLVATFGPEQNAASWIALQYMHLSFMPAVGMSHAVTAIVGRCIGMGRPDLAQRRAFLGLRVTMLYMGLCAAAFVLLRGPMVEIFVNSSQYPTEQRELIIQIGGRLLILAAVFQVFDAVGITMIGALRGAGDTVWPGVVTAILAWTLIIGLGKALMEIAPQWGSIGPWVAASAYIMGLGMLLLWRFASGHWKRVRILDTAAGARIPDAAFDPLSRDVPTAPETVR